jgi:hypothetical protein
VRRAVWILAAVIALGCVPSSGAPVPDARPVPSASTDATCEKLKALGCAEGQDPACPRVLANLRIRPIIAINEACVMRAVSATDAAACAGFRCRTEAAP